ncbi:cyclic nucleotide-gated ion channel 1-like [Pyrus ussuriensis x Pyrus communis]|uniref:Cyclic nucleotide-gated ion channel 1-like n=1 Tax=Pyrus ussuriensis x Pyrus communis TaxID=2448454 RepID=A0A5N5GVS3_9ROSA|nr:cyclic nucleotide-gated ion channel 1-like [Pyrus ussuriensis x Pyrus communis]
MKYNLKNRRFELLKFDVVWVLKINPYILKKIRILFFKGPADIYIYIYIWGNEGEASKEDRGHTSRTTAERPTIEAQRHQPKIFFPLWDIIFIVSSAFSLFIDPLICYIPVIVEKDTCYIWDQPLMWTFLALRSIGDLFYVMDIVVFLKRFNTKLSAKSSARASSTKTIDDHHLSTLRSFIQKKQVRFLAILIRIWVALPFLQLYGSMWYFFAVDREIACWQDYCLHENICDRDVVRYFFYCGDTTQQNNQEINLPRLKLSCPVELPKNMSSFPFDYGIFLPALQSNMSTSRDLLRKILQCFWWGLRNLSCDLYKRVGTIFSISEFEGAGIPKNSRAAQIETEDENDISSPNRTNIYYVPSPYGFTKESSNSWK